MKRLLIVTVLAVLCATTSWAIDRDAASIEGVTVSGRDYAEADDINVIAWTEQRLPTDQPNWALLLSVAIGNVSPAHADSSMSWGAALGLKYYLSDLLSATAEGTYRKIDASHSDIVGVRGGAKLRFVDAEEAISPYARCTLDIQRVRSSAEWIGYNDSSAQLMLTVAGGCDILLRDDLAISLELAASTAERISSDGPEYGDGWGGAVTMRYFF